MLLPQLADQTRQPLGPDPHLQSVLSDVDALDEELDNPRLFGGEQLIPERGEVGEQGW
jgi:hypothetical protein